MKRVRALEMGVAKAMGESRRTVEQKCQDGNMQRACK